MACQSLHMPRATARGLLPPSVPYLLQTGIHVLAPSLPTGSKNLFKQNCFKVYKWLTYNAAIFLQFIILGCSGSLAACRLFPVAGSGGYSLLQCRGFLSRRLLLL